MAPSPARRVVPNAVSSRPVMLRVSVSLNKVRHLRNHGKSRQIKAFEETPCNSVNPAETSRPLLRIKGLQVQVLPGASAVHALTSPSFKTFP